MDRLKPVYFGNGENYSDDDYDFHTPDSSEYDEDEEEDVSTELATSESDGSLSSSSEEDDDGSSSSSSEEDDDGYDGSASEDEEDPAEADPIPRHRLVHICRFLVDRTKCMVPFCAHFDVEPTVLKVPRTKRALENPENPKINPKNTPKRRRHSE